MSRVPSSIVMVASFLIVLVFNSCSRNQIAGPSEQENQLNEMIGPPPVLPSDSNVNTINDLARLEQARILQEQKGLELKKLAGVQGAPDGNYSFDASVDVSKSMGGVVIFENNNVRAEIVGGGISFRPGFHWDAKIARSVLVSTEAYIYNRMTGNAVYKITFKTSYSNSLSRNLYYWNQTQFAIIGGFVPVWVTYGIQIDGGCALQANASCSMQQGVTIVSDLKLGVKWENAKWSPIISYSPTASASTPTYSVKANLSIQPYLNVFVTAYFYSLIGPRLLVTPYLTLNLNFPSRYIDRSASLRGYAYLSLKGLDQKNMNLYDQQLFLWTYPFPRIRF